MNLKAMAALAVMTLAALPAGAEDMKAFKLSIDGVAVDIDPGESLDVTLPGGKQAKVRLDRNAFATFSGEAFSFVHPSGISVTKTDLGSGIMQYLMASALGTIVVVQEYGKMNPVSLDQLMLQQMTKESVQAGAELTPAGHDFRPLAERILQTWDQARHQVALPDGFTATFRFGGPVALQDQLNVAWVLWMKEHAPTVALQLEAGYSDTLTDRILAGTMDATTLYLPRQRPGLVVEELLIEKLVLVRHPRMEGAWQDHFVMVNWGQDFGREFVEAFSDAPIPTISVGLGALGLQYVLALRGAAYLPRSLVGSMLAERRLCPVEGAPVFERPVYLVYPAFSRDPELQSLALGGVRGVAATLSSGA